MNSTQDGTNGTPDLRDRFIVGAGASYAPGDAGGASSVTLSVGQMPSHTHAAFDTGHSHQYLQDQGGYSGGLSGNTAFGEPP